MEKQEFAGTNIIVRDVNNHIYAKISKSFTSKLGSFVCKNPQWEISNEQGHNPQNILTDMRVLSALVAIKANADIVAAANQRLDFVKNVNSAGSDADKNN